MIKKLQIIIVSIISINSFSQDSTGVKIDPLINKTPQFVFDINGLTNSIVVETDTMKSIEMYNKCIEWINLTYVNASEVIQSNIIPNYEHYIEKQIFPIAEAILANYSPNSLKIFNQQLILF